MGGLFKDPTANRSEAAKVLQEVRVKSGGKFFDAFATHLEDIYVLDAIYHQKQQHPQSLNAE